MIVDYSYIEEFFGNKTVVVFGSGPSCVNNDSTAINKYDLIVRVNNYGFEGLEKQVGNRTDVHYAFYGSSIKKSKEELKGQGVKLCMCKCPNDKPFESKWHIDNNQPYGVDYRYIYKKRKDFWFCDTYIPTTKHFMKLFNMLGKHQPTTGFAAIWEIINLPVAKVYITGYDFFTSFTHNVTQRWRPKNLDDPFKHIPETEAIFMKRWALADNRIKLDRTLRRQLRIG